MQGNRTSLTAEGNQRPNVSWSAQWGRTQGAVLQKKRKVGLWCIKQQTRQEELPHVCCTAPGPQGSIVF